MTKLILMRHGESIWNKKNIFTGWVDVPLSEKGINEAIEGGKKIKDIPIDVVFTSTLIRAQMTLFLVLLSHFSKKTPVFIHKKGKEATWAHIYDEENKKNIIPIYASWHLNERMYGRLQGLNKEKVKKEVGEKKFIEMRRSYEGRPPQGESLKMTSLRTLPYFKKNIMPYLVKSKNVFISAHGNSLRSIVMFLEKLSKEKVVSLEIPTGKPIIYNYKNKKFEKENLL